MKQFLLIILLFNASYLGAQFQYGLRLGQSWSLFPEAHPANAQIQWLPKPIIGAGFRLFLDPYLSIQNDWTWVQKGSRYRNDEDVLDEYFHYGEGQLLTQWHAFPWFWLGGGFYGAYALAMERFEQYPDYTDRRFLPFQLYHRRFDWGPVVGLGASRSFQYGTCSIDLRYEVGILDPFRPVRATSQYHHCWQASLSYYYHPKQVKSLF